MSSLLRRSSQPSLPMIASVILSVTKNTIFLPTSSPLKCTSCFAVPIGLTFNSPNAHRMRMMFVLRNFVTFSLCSCVKLAFDQ